MGTPVTINDAAYQAFFRRVDDALVSFWNKPGLATSIQRSGKCANGLVDETCRALPRGIYLDEHRAAVVAEVKRFNSDQTTHAMLPSSCTSVRPIDMVTATQDFGCALQEYRLRKYGRKAP